MQAHFGIIRPAQSVANIWYSTTCHDLPHSCPSVERFVQVKTLEYYAWPVPGVSGNGATALNMHTGIYSKSSTPAKCNWLLKLISTLTWHAWIPVPKVQNDIMLKSSVRNAWAVWILFKMCQESIPLFSRCYSSVAYNFQIFPGTHHTIYMHPKRNPPNPPGSHKEKLGHLALKMGHPWAPKMAVVYWRKHAIFDDLRFQNLWPLNQNPKTFVHPWLGRKCLAGGRNCLKQCTNGSEELEFSHLRINWIPSLPSNNVRNILQLFQSAKT